MADVKEYGAKGDGVTDDTQAIQQALEARRAATGLPGGEVHFPPGNYIVSDTLLVAHQDGLVVRGAGSGGRSGAGTHLYWTGPSDRPMILVSNTMLSTFEAFTITPVTPLLAGIEVQAVKPAVPDGFFSTRNAFRDITIDGVLPDGSLLDFGVRITAIDEATGLAHPNGWNNDFHLFERLFATNLRYAGVSIEHDQSHDHLFVDSTLMTGRSGVSTAMLGTTRRRDPWTPAPRTAAARSTGSGASWGCTRWRTSTSERRCSPSTSTA